MVGPFKLLCNIQIVVWPRWSIERDWGGKCHPYLGGGLGVTKSNVGWMCVGGWGYVVGGVTMSKVL